MQECKIYLKSVVSESVSEVFVVGKTYFEFGNRCIEFENDEQNVKTKTKIVLTDSYVDVHKSGDLGMFLHLQEGKGSISDITTPYGVIPFSVEAKTVSVKEQEKQVDIILEYKANHGGEKEIFNLEIKCRIIN